MERYFALFKMMCSLLTRCDRSRDKTMLGAYLIQNFLHKVTGLPRRQQTELLINFKEVSFHFKRFTSELTPYYEIFVQLDYEMIQDFKGLNNQVVFDIGANIGMYALRLSTQVKAPGRIFSFEPNPDAFQRLKKNLALNKITNVAAINLAVSDTNERTLFALNKKSTVAGRLKRFQKSTSETIDIEVQSVTLDTFCQNNNIFQIDLLKIDTEGNELNVLFGARNILHNTQKIVLEYHSATLKDKCSKLLTREFNFREILDNKKILYFASDSSIHTPKSLLYTTNSA